MVCVDLESVRINSCTEKIPGQEWNEGSGGISVSVFFPVRGRSRLPPACLSKQINKPRERERGQASYDGLCDLMSPEGRGLFNATAVLKIYSLFFSGSDKQIFGAGVG